MTALAIAAVAFFYCVMLDWENHELRKRVNALEQRNVLVHDPNYKFKPEDSYVGHRDRG